MANLICTYNITNTKQPTHILNQTSNISDIIYNGVSIGVVREYTFGWDGTHTLEFVLIDGTVIPDYTFAYCSLLTSITIPDSVTTIGDFAFSECSLLTSITIPESVIYIGEGAFSYCYDLTSVIIPDSVTTIGARAFSDCYNLTSITIPDSVTTIGEYAFYRCDNLTSVTIGSGVTSIGDYAFSDCYALTSITIPDSVTSFGEGAFSDCYDLTSVTIGSGVTTIGDFAFSYCYNLTSITIPDSVTTIGARAFSKCSSLTSINIPASTTYICSRAFSECSSLTSITIPESVIYIGKLAFDECFNLKQITSLNKYAPLVYSSTFGVAEGGTLYYPKGADYSSWLSGDKYYLGYYGWKGVTFGTADSSIKPVVHKITCTYNVSNTGEPTAICNRTEYISDITYNGSSIGVTKNYTFNTTGKHTLEFILSTPYIETYGFYDCDTLTSVKIGEGVKGIYEYAFENCKSLKSIEIPLATTYIGDYAFNNCSELSTIISYAIEPDDDIRMHTFHNVKTGGTLYYPKGIKHSHWLVTSLYYLGYYGWNGVEFDMDNPPELPKGEIVTPNQTKTIVTSGETFQYPIETNNIDYLHSYYIYFNGNRYSAIDGFISIEMIDNFNFNITVEENEGDERHCSIYFDYMDYNGNLLTHKLTITQDAKYVEPEPDEPSINLEYTNITVPTGGVTTTLDIETNGVEDIEIIAPDWVEVIDKGGYYEIEVLPNEDGYREGEVIFIGNPNKPNKVQQNIIITQKGNEEMATSIALYKTRLDFAATGGTGYVQVDYVNAQTVNTPTCTQSWVTIEQTQSGNTTTNGQPTKQVQYRITMQPSSFARQTNITFSCVGTNGNTVSQNKFMVYQAAPATPDEPAPELPEDSDDITYSPIWKDVEYTFVDDTEYGIYYDRVYYFQGREFKEEILLFKGRAYLAPNADRVLVNINKICQNFMDENPNIFNGAVGYEHSYNEFKLKNSYGTLLHTYRFVNDWSYKELTLGIKTNPIIPHIADGQKLFFSAFATDKKAIIWGMRYYDGTADYNNTEYVTNAFETVVVTESRQKYVNTFYFGDKSFTVLPKCECKYVLYYVNPNGGYDWLPITGKVVRKDKVETFVYTKNYNNTTADFGKNRYLANITVSYNLNTGWLTQEQSDRMWEVLESNTVWLHNLEEDKIYPVMITDTNIEHKQKGNKKKMLSYGINVELSHTRERV